MSACVIGWCCGPVAAITPIQVVRPPPDLLRHTASGIVFRNDMHLMPFAGPGYHERKQAPLSSQLVHDRAVCSAESQRNRQACTILYLHILTPGNLSQSIQLRDFQSTDYSRIATMIPDVTTHCSCMYVRSMLVKPFLNVKFDILMETLEIIKFHARMCTCKQQWIMHI